METMLQIYLRSIHKQNDPLMNEKMLQLLPDEQREKIKKFQSEDDRKRSFVGSMLLKEMLQSRQMTLDDLYYGTHGKPLCDGMYFNLSHSGEYVLGVVADGAIGCDIERIRPLSYDVTKRFFSEKERKYVSLAEDPIEARILVWTRKEAYAKMTGEGMAADFASFCTESMNQREAYFYTRRMETYFISICLREPLSEKSRKIFENPSCYL